MAQTQTLFLFLLLSLHVWMIYSSPVGEENISDGSTQSRLQSPRLRHNARNLRIPPYQRTSTRRDYDKEDENDQEKDVQEVEDTEAISRSRNEARKQKYFYQTEENFKKKVENDSLSLNKHGLEVPVESETSLDSIRILESKIEPEEVPTKSRDLKESILKSNTKSKVKPSENQERNDKIIRGLRISLPTNGDEQTSNESISQNARLGNLNGKLDIERKESEKSNPVQDDESEIPSGKVNKNVDALGGSQQSIHELNGERFINDFFVEYEKTYEGDKIDQRQFFPVLSPFSEQRSSLGIINRYKKQPSEQGIFPLGPSYTLKTVFEGRAPGFSIVPEEWRGQDVLGEVESETPSPKGFPKIAFMPRANGESGQNIDIHPEPGSVQTTQNSPMEHFVEEIKEIKPFTPRTLINEGRITSTSSSISSDHSSSTTTATTEDWSAERARYSFSTNQEDRISDLSHQRKESREGGTVRGSYSYSDGYVLRTVEYIADKNGYRIVKEKSSPLSPEGPKVNPEGHAAVKAEVDGYGYDYIVHGHELPKRRDYHRHMKMTRNKSI